MLPQHKAWLPVAWEGKEDIGDQLLFSLIAHKALALEKHRSSRRFKYSHIHKAFVFSGNTEFRMENKLF